MNSKELENENELELEFQNCVRKFNNLDKSEKNIIFYYVYGIYKQSLFGNNRVEKPYWFNYRSVNKWNSWKNQFGKTKEEAKLLYIAIMNKIV